MTANVCRLCGGASGILISIFQTPECFEKIEAVVPDVVILRNDSLPKVVCHRCVAKVKEYFEFKATCVSTQKLLKAALPWMSSSIVNGGKISLAKPASPTVTYMGGPLAFPFEVRDPEVEVLTLSDDEDKADTTTSSIPPARTPEQPRQQRRVPVGRVQPSSQTPQRTILPSNHLESFPQPGTSKVRHAAQVTSSSKSNVGVTITPISPILSSVDIKQKTIHPSASSSLQPCSSRENAQTCPRPGRLSNDKLVAKKSPRSSKEMRTACSMSMTAGPSTSAEQVTTLKIENQIEKSNVAPSLVPVETNRIFLASHPSSFVSEKQRNSQGALQDTVISHQSSSGVAVKNIRKTPYEKPKPKCKKHLTESDIKRICAKYPNVDPVKINEKHLIFPCKICNKILMTEEAISTHACMAVEINETKKSIDQVPSKGCNIINQNEDSNDSSSSVELIACDDDDFNRQLTPKHLCNVCGLQFHNFARLQKHQLTH